MHNSGPEAIHLFVLWQIFSVNSIESLQLINLKFHDFPSDEKRGFWWQVSAGNPKEICDNSSFYLMTSGYPKLQSCLQKDDWPFITSTQKCLPGFTLPAIRNIFITHKLRTKNISPQLWSYFKCEKTWDNYYFLLKGFSLVLRMPRKCASLC